MDDGRWPNTVASPSLTTTTTTLINTLVVYLIRKEINPINPLSILHTFIPPSY